MNVDGNGLEQDRIHQGVVVSTSHELPEGGSLEGVNILRVSHRSASEREVGCLKYGRLLHQREGNIVGCAQAGIVSSRGVEGYCAMGLGQNPMFVQSGGNRIYGDDERNDRSGYGGWCEIRGERVLPNHGTRIRISVPAGRHIVSECGE